MNFDLTKAETFVNLAIKAEFHAFVLLIVGAILSVTGHHDEGLMVLGGAVGVFKGKIS